MIHQIGLINRDKIKDKTVITIKIRSHKPMVPLFFILSLLKFTEMPSFKMI